MSNHNTKTCTMCGTTYPATVDYFYKQIRGKYGVNAWCKQCHSERNRQNNAKLRENPEYREKQRVYDKQHYWDNVEVYREHNRQYYAENQERERTRIHEKYLKNAEHYRAYRRKRYYENPDYEHTMARLWRESNPDRVLENARNWRKNNPDKIKAHKKARFARKRGNGGSFTSAEILALYEQQNGHCWYCQAELGDNYHVDHFIPLSKGGTNDIGNIRLACPSCNQRKSNKLPWEFGRLL